MVARLLPLQPNDPLISVTLHGADAGYTLFKSCPVLTLLRIPLYLKWQSLGKHETSVPGGGRDAYQPPKDTALFSGHSNQLNITNIVADGGSLLSCTSNLRDHEDDGSGFVLANDEIDKYPLHFACLFLALISPATFHLLSFIQSSRFFSFLPAISFV